jgi:hypothetical protein
LFGEFDQPERIAGLIAALAADFHIWHEPDIVHAKINGMRRFFCDLWRSCRAFLSDVNRLNRSLEWQVMLKTVTDKACL